MKEPKIGVFICHCGTNIGGVVDVPQVVEYVKTLPDVVHAERNLYTCADDGLSAIKNAIKQHSLNRVIVASCTPRTHAPLFRRTCESAGLNPYLFEFVNLREHCSWVHMKEPKRATEKAKDLIRMGVARSRLLEPQVEPTVTIEKTALVIGGGASGMSAALSLANQGFSTHLVEKEAELGGMVSKLYKLSPTNRSAAELLKPLIEMVRSHKNIKIHAPCTVTDVSGYIGNFNVTLSGGDVGLTNDKYSTTSADAEQEDSGKHKERVSKTHVVKAGTIIVATGAEELKPNGLYGYGTYKNVLTQLELEQKMANFFPASQMQEKNVVMIQCAGGRGTVVSYCSKRCCFTAIKNAILLKEMNPMSHIHILHNEVRAYGVNFEREYRRAQELGVKFSKYSPERPKVEQNNGGLLVKFFDEGLGMERELRADLVVLSAPLVARPEAEELSKMLKVPLGADRFFFEAHVKLRPVDFATDGIFVCGTAKGPTNTGESVEQALGAASRASIPLAKGVVTTEAITSSVDALTCRGCGKCEEECDYHAIEVVPVKDALGERLVARTNDALCKGCGKCSAICCNGSITMRHFTTPQIMAMVEAALGAC